MKWYEREGASMIAVVWVGEENKKFKMWWITLAVSEEQCSDAALIVKINSCMQKDKLCKLK